MSNVKTVEKVVGAPDLNCASCAHVARSVCNHPEFRELKVKPLIIAPQGEAYPAFCPLEKPSEGQAPHRVP